MYQYFAANELTTNHKTIQMRADVWKCHHGAPGFTLISTGKTKTNHLRSLLNSASI